MFTLAELRMILQVLKDPRIGVPFEVAHVAASLNQKLTENIAELESRENRQKAASALRAVSNDEPGQIAG